MGDVVIMQNITRLNVPPERILDAAAEAGLTECVVIGYDKDGAEYFASSIADAGTVLWLLERSKMKLLQAVEDD